MIGEERKKMLVLYSGGTIGMKKNKEGAFEPAPEEFINKIASCDELHDKTFNLPPELQDYFVLR